MKRLVPLLVIVLAFALVAKSPAALADDPLQVVATTSIIADVARNVGGDQVEVTSVVPVGGDPHSYIPSPRDVIGIVEADLVLVNGMDLEENLLDVVVDNASVDPVVVSMGVPVLSTSFHEQAAEQDDPDHSPYIGILGEDPICGIAGADSPEEDGDKPHEDETGHDHGPCDPHVWMNPRNVIIWATNIADAYAAADPDNADAYHANAEAYIAELETLDEDIALMVETIPEANRALVTNHIFLSYFAVAYEFEVAGVILPGGGAAADVDPRTMTRLIDLVDERGIPAIFGEYSVSSELAETIADEADHEVQVVLLYTGALSDSGGPASTYLDYMRYNATLITEALGASG